MKNNPGLVPGLFFPASAQVADADGLLVDRRCVSAIPQRIDHRPAAALSQRLGTDSANETLRPAWQARSIEPGRAQDRIVEIRDEIRRTLEYLDRPPVQV